MSLSSSALRSVAFVLALVPAAFVVACTGDTVTDSTVTAVSADEAQALVGAQESFASQKAEISACIAAFETCKAAAGADEAACRSALHDCLPDTPPPPPRCGGRPAPDGGAPPPPSGSAGPAPTPPASGGPAPTPPASSGPPPASTDAPPAPSGSVPPPPANIMPPPRPAASGAAPAPSGSARPAPGAGSGSPEDCDKPGGKGGKGGGKPEVCGRLPLPAREALAACHTALDACVAGGGDRDACFATERSCVKAAFDAAFRARCNELPATAPAEARARCAEGIEPPAATTTGN